MNQTPSLLGRLRGLIPQRPGVTYDEALRIAELQATLLAERFGGPDGLAEAQFALLPRIRVVHEAIGVSGMSHWTGVEWLITLNTGDSPVRQRFTLLHEYKHIVDHGSAARLYTGSPRATPTDQAEHAADYFAGCALVPKRELKAAWGTGMQRVSDLAAHFGVSAIAISVRLAQTKLSVLADAPPHNRCARPIPSLRSGPQHFRVASPRRITS